MEGFDQSHTMQLGLSSADQKPFFDASEENKEEAKVVVCSRSFLEQSSTLINSTTANMSNIFRSKEEYLFVFGGTTEADNQLATYEVFDLKSGIWRQFVDQMPQRLGHPTIRVAHALPMPGKTIWQLMDKNRTIRKFSIGEMHTEEVEGIEMPDNVVDL